MNCLQAMMFYFCFMNTDAFKCKNLTCRNGGTCAEGKDNKELPTCK